MATFGAEDTAPRGTEGTNTLDPTLAAQARLLDMLSQIVLQLENHVRSKDLSAIHDEDMILSATASELSASADSIAPNQTADFKSTITAFCSRVSALHVVADLNQQAGSEAELAKVLESFSKIKAYFSKEVIARAQLYRETFTCSMHRDVVGRRTDLCRKCGMPLDQSLRVLPSISGFSLHG